MILFTADWHIKLGQKNVPVEWAKERYLKFFDDLWEIEQVQNIHLHIVGGDIFDRIPTMEELELYFEWVKSCSVKTIVFDGNHEATQKNKTFFDQLADVTHNLNSKVKVITTPTVFDEYGMGILPYCHLHKKDWHNFFPSDIPIFTHVRGEVPPHVKPEVDLDLFNRFPVVFSGDLHAHSNCQRNIVYPGSPMTTSFHRNEVETGYILINNTNWNWSWHSFELPQLIRKTVSNPAEMIPTKYHHTIYEVEGDVQELAAVKNSDLLDKKVVKKANEASLILNPEMSLHEELEEYLKYVLQIPEEKIPEIVGIFNDYTSKFEME